MACDWIYHTLQKLKRRLKRDRGRQRERYEAIVAKLDLLIGGQNDMVSRLDDEFEGLQRTLADIKTTATEGIAKVLALLATIDLSDVETQAQGLLAQAQETLTNLQTAFAGLPDPPAPPEDPAPEDPEA